MRITGYFLILLGIFITACGDDDVVFTPDEAIYFVSPDTTSITRTVNDVIEDAYFSLDSVIDSVFVGYQIDTTGMPPMNLSLNDLDEITERIGFSTSTESASTSVFITYTVKWEFKSCRSRRCCSFCFCRAIWKPNCHKNVKGRYNL